MRICYYTVLTGDYEKPQDNHYISPRIDHYFITDGETQPPKGFKLIKVPKKTDPQKSSRLYKICIHKLLKDYDIYIYGDSNFRIINDLTILISKVYNKHVGWSIKRHPTRNCIYKEGARVIEIGKDDENTVNTQLDAYRPYVKVIGGLYENGFFIRANNEKINGLFELWYKEIKTHSYRDQISLPYILTKTDIKPTVFTNYNLGQYMRIFPHDATVTNLAEKKPRSKATTIHYFTPGTSDKNLGREYNRACEMVPEGDWICIRDGDTMFLTPDWCAQIEDIVDNYGQKFDLISCVTNRLGLKHQLYNGTISNDWNVYKHYELAKKLSDRYWDSVIETKLYTAGLFMLFNKKLWNEIKFKHGLTSSRDSSDFIDAQFSQEVLKRKKKIGIARGVYLFHAYRIHQPTSRSYEHLKQ
jgi:hypothetical protein